MASGFGAESWGIGPFTFTLLQCSLQQLRSSPFLYNAIMYFIALEVNHPLRLNSNITDATATQVYRAVVCPGLVFANWRYARSPKNSPITTQAQ